MARNLNNTQLTILNNAAARDERRILPLPKLRAPTVAVTKTIKSMIAHGLVEAVPAGRDDEVWAHTELNGNTTLVITAAGLAASGVADETADRRDRRPTRGRKAGRAAKGAKKPARARVADTGGRSKQDTVIALLRRQQGATIEEMMEATGWQTHSVRGFMSGALKKRLGLEVISEKDSKTGERRYFVAAIKSK